jgi:hypothetical protein
LDLTEASTPSGNPARYEQGEAHGEEHQPGKIVRVK